MSFLVDENWPLRACDRSSTRLRSAATLTASSSPRRWLLAAAVLLTSTVAHGGEPFVIATEAEDAQAAAVAPGEFVVSWVAEIDPGEPVYEIHGRRFVAGSGGAEFQVSQLTQPIYVWNNALEYLGDRLLALWSNSSGGPLTGEDRQGGLPEGKRQRVLAADGIPLSDEEIGFGRAAAALAASRYVVVGRGVNAEGDIVGTGQIFDADDEPVGTPFEFTAFEGVFDGMRHWLSPLKVQVLDDGFFILWRQEIRLRDNLYGQAFSADGVPLGPVSTIALERGYGDLAPAERGWLVTWRQDDSLYVRQLSDFGQPLGATRVVHQSQHTIREYVLAREGTGFLLVWIERDEAQSLRAVWARRLGATGVPVGIAFQLTAWSESLYGVRAVALGDGTALVTWTDYAQRVVRGRQVEVVVLFVDGFESGDTTAWSATVP